MYDARWHPQSLIWLFKLKKPVRHLLVSRQLPRSFPAPLQRSAFLFSWLRLLPGWTGKASKLHRAGQGREQACSWAGPHSGGGGRAPLSQSKAKQPMGQGDAARATTWSGKRNKLWGGINCIDRVRFIPWRTEAWRTHLHTSQACLLERSFSRIFFKTLFKRKLTCLNPVFLLNNYVVCVAYRALFCLATVLVLCQLCQPYFFKYKRKWSIYI